MGLVAAEQNEFAKSRDLLTEAIASFVKLQDKLGMCESLEAFACLEAKEQKWSRAAVPCFVFVFGFFILCYAILFYFILFYFILFCFILFYFILCFELEIVFALGQ
jgi:hypothetical protein